MLKLKRLHIRQFRRLAPNTELVFNDGFNVLLGRNGAGKTSLLELIVAVLRADLSAYEHETFDLEWEYAIEGGGLEVAVRNAPKPEPHQTDRRRKKISNWHIQLGFSVNQRRLTYSASSSGPVEISVTKLPRRRFDVFVSGFVHEIVGYLCTTKPERDWLWMELAAIESGVFRYDEVLGCYHVLTTGEAGGSGTAVPACEVEREDDVAVMVGWSYLPFEIVSRIGGKENAEIWQPHFSSDEWPILQEMAVALNAKTVQFEGRLQETVPSTDSEISTYRGFTIQVTFHDGRTVSAPLLSFGQKRLLSFLYHVASNKHFVIADEMVNGLHWEWIETCLRAIGDRQAFLTSQNPLLLDALPIDSQEAAARTFIHCRSHLDDHTTTWHWHNLSERDARELWEAYSVGIQSIGEILRSRGMW